MIGQSCAHHENCDSGWCDLHGDVEHGSCKNKCVSISTDQCPRQYCNAKCDLCLNNLLSLPLNSQGAHVGRWKGYPEARVERSPNTHFLRMWMKEAEETRLHLRIPPSCVEPLPCLEVNGTFFVGKLDAAQLSVHTGMFTGFPGKQECSPLTRRKKPLESIFERLPASN
jgi:hypothetical protein